MLHPGKCSRAPSPVGFNRPLISQSHADRGGYEVHALTSPCNGTERGKGMSMTAIAQHTPPISCPSSLSPFWRPSSMFHFTTRRPTRGSPKLSTYGKELRRLGTVQERVFEDYVLRKMTAWFKRISPKRVRRAMGTKRAARTRPIPTTAATVGWSTRMLRSL